MSEQHHKIVRDALELIAEWDFRIQGDCVKDAQTVARRALVALEELRVQHAEVVAKYQEERSIAQIRSNELRTIHAKCVEAESQLDALRAEMNPQDFSDMLLRTEAKPCE